MPRSIPKDLPSRRTQRRCCPPSVPAPVPGGQRTDPGFYRQVNSVEWTSYLGVHSLLPPFLVAAARRRGSHSDLSSTESRDIPNPLGRDDRPGEYFWSTHPSSNAELTSPNACLVCGADETAAAIASSDCRSSWPFRRAGRAVADAGRRGDDSTHLPTPVQAFSLTNRRMHSQDLAVPVEYPHRGACKPRQDGPPALAETLGADPSRD